MTLGAIIFDLDGVLIDSEPLWGVVEREVFAAVGLTLTRADCESTAGLRCDEVVRLWFERRPWTGASVETITGRILDGMISAFATNAAACPGALAAVDLASSLSVPLAVASSSPLRLIEAAVARLGVEERFTVLASAEHEAAGKPAPGVYLSAARTLGVEPTGCVAIEDSPNGVRAARAAGMRCIGVPAEVHRAEVERLAHVTLPSLVALRAAHIVGPG